MRYAYADPPYPGMGGNYVEKQEVDHQALVARLVRDYPDGWALSTNSTTLAEVLRYTPRAARVAAWVKTFASWKPSQRVVYAWEPLIFCGGRPKRGKEPSTTDWMACAIATERGLFGSKPEAFCHWVLDILGFEAGDSMDDLFPGTNVMGRVVAQRQTQIRFLEIPVEQYRIDGGNR